MKLDRGILLRSVLAVVLAGTALVFFLSHRTGTLRTEQPAAGQEQSAAETRADWRVDLPEIDREIDSALSRFGIERKAIRKKNVPVPEANFSRVERRVDVSPDLVVVELNSVLNDLAHEYQGRAIASENSKERLVTIHIELNGFIVQTLILMPKPQRKTV